MTTKIKLEINILDKWQKENSILYVANLYTFRDIADDDIKIFWKFISEAINETNTDKEFRILNLSLFKNLVVRKTDINNNQQLSVNFQQGKYNEYSCSYCEYSVLCKTLACDREKSEIEENE